MEDLMSTDTVRIIAVNGTTWEIVGLDKHHETHQIVAKCVDGELVGTLEWFTDDGAPYHLRDEWGWEGML